MRTRKRGVPVWRLQPITAPKPNFLRVNAQMHNLDKQKTVPRRQPLPAMLTDHLTNIQQTDKSV